MHLSPNLHSTIIYNSPRDSRHDFLLLSERLLRSALLLLNLSLCWRSLLPIRHLLLVYLRLIALFCHDNGCVLRMGREMGDPLLESVNRLKFGASPLPFCTHRSVFLTRFLSILQFQAPCSTLFSSPQTPTIRRHRRNAETQISPPVFLLFVNDNMRTAFTVIALILAVALAEKYAMVFGTADSWWNYSITSVCPLCSG